MNQKQKRKWEAIRAKGKWRYVALVALFFTVWVVVTMPILEYLLLSKQFNPYTLWIRIPINLIGGIIIGLIFWHIGERRYDDSE